MFANSYEPFDAIYHGPFSPEVAPELWNVELFAELRSILKPTGRLVTYCVKSSVQRALKNVGFRLEKTPGPVGGKREVLIAFNEGHPVFEINYLCRLCSYNKIAVAVDTFKESICEAIGISTW